MQNRDRNHKDYHGPPRDSRTPADSRRDSNYARQNGPVRCVALLWREGGGQTRPTSLSTVVIKSAPIPCLGSECVQVAFTTSDPMPGVGPISLGGHMDLDLDLVLVHMAGPIRC